MNQNPPIKSSYLSKVSQDPQSLKKMIKGIAHEINNPLMIIVGHASRIEKNLTFNGTVGTHEILNMVNGVRANVEKIAKIVADLGLFGGDLGKYEFTRLSMSEILRNCIAEVKPRFENYRVPLEVETTHDSWIYGNSMLLNRALTGVLSQAFSGVYKSDGEKIVKVSHLKTDGNSHIKVTWTPTQVQSNFEELFAPFQEDQRRLSGVDLFMARCIIENHNGELRLASNQGQHSFDIRLPHLD